MNQHQAHPCQGSSVHDGFPHTMGTFQNCEHQTLSMIEFSQGIETRTHQVMKVLWRKVRMQLLTTVVEEENLQSYRRMGRGSGNMFPRDDHDNDGIRKSHHGDHDKDVLDVEIDDHDDSEENYTSPANSKGYRATGQPFKSLKLGQGQEDAATFGSALNNKEYNKSSHPHMVQSDGNQALHEKNESLVTKAMG
ncbi:hypothetical protein JHK87_003369 [Glycine soja]|nr:hypothetical protein JHK87_003369 [Glycine soja]